MKEQIIKTASFLWDLKALESDKAVALFISCFCIQTTAKFL